MRPKDDEFLLSMLVLVVFWVFCFDTRKLICCSGAGVGLLYWWFFAESNALVLVLMPAMFVVLLLFYLGEVFVSDMEVWCCVMLAEI